LTAQRDALAAELASVTRERDALTASASDELKTRESECHELQHAWSSLDRDAAFLDSLAANELAEAGAAAVTATASSEDAVAAVLAAGGLPATVVTTLFEHQRLVFKRIAARSARDTELLAARARLAETGGTASSDSPLAVRVAARRAAVGALQDLLESAPSSGTVAPVSLANADQLRDLSATATASAWAPCVSHVTAALCSSAGDGESSSADERHALAAALVAALTAGDMTAREELNARAAALAATSSETAAAASAATAAAATALIETRMAEAQAALAHARRVHVQQEAACDQLREQIPAARARAADQRDRAIAALAGCGAGVSEGEAASLVASSDALSAEDKARMADLKVRKKENYSF
jgi:hypothetical protein